jgi:glycerol-3-phosphate dehydrogenase
MELSEKNRPPIHDQRFQVIVIGGGINGVAIARECARGGRRVLLLEQNDFAAGTTSRSTRIIHGGLRYLEHGEISLVRESLQERQRFLAQYPHLVRPMQFLLALGPDSTRSALKVRLGLWLYRRFAGKSRSPSNIGDERARFESTLDSGGQWSVFEYDDAQCEFPERVVAEWLVDAAHAGATIRNHAQVLAIDVRHGRATGVLMRDLLTGKEERVEAAWIINATGPWADRMCQRSSIATHGPMLGGVRGSHVVLPCFPGAPKTAVFTEAVDGRPIFVIPWNHQILLGTTEVPDRDDPSRTIPSAAEVDYLLNSANTLFSRANLSIEHVRYAFAGVRPLPFAQGGNPGKITRRHFLHDHSKEGVQRLISVLGGKLTTAASLARACARKIGIAAAEPRLVAVAHKAPETSLDDFIDEIAGLPGFSEHAAEQIAEWHGKRTLPIIQLARTNPDMRATLCPHTQHIVAEAADALVSEFAVTLADVLLRRVPVAFAACWSDECSHIASGRIAAAVGWDEKRRRAELQAFEAEYHAFLRKPAELAVEEAAEPLA